jgi:hypothetical protein
MGSTPYNFACAKCKRGASNRKQHCRNTATGQLMREGRHRFSTTGRRTKQKWKRGDTHRSCLHRYEYRCVTCGHVGWSSHRDVEDQWKKEHATP